MHFSKVQMFYLIYLLNEKKYRIGMSSIGAATELEYNQRIKWHEERKREKKTSSSSNNNNQQAQSKADLLGDFVTIV